MFALPSPRKPVAPDRGEKGSSPLPTLGDVGCELPPLVRKSLSRSVPLEREDVIESAWILLLMKGIERKHCDEG